MSFCLGHLSVSILGGLLAQAPAQEATLLPGQVAPEFRLAPLNPDEVGGDAVALSRYVGASPAWPRSAVLVSFYAHWARPCQTGLRTLTALEREFAAKGLEIIVISMDGTEQGELGLRTAVKEAGSHFVMLRDDNRAVAGRYHASVLPANFVIDQGGKVAWVGVGMSSQSDDQLRAAVVALLAKAGPPPSSPSAAVAKPAPALPATAPAREKKEQVAVMPLAGNGVKAETRKTLDDLLVFAVDNRSPFRAISPSELDALLGREKVKEMAGCPPEALSCAAEIIGALGTKLMVAGSVRRLGGNILLSLSLVDTVRVEIKARSQVKAKDDENAYDVAIDQAVRDLFGVNR
jgi:peroxiredoxin